VDICKKTRTPLSSCETLWNRSRLISSCTDAAKRVSL